MTGASKFASIIVHRTELKITYAFSSVERNNCQSATRLNVYARYFFQ